MKKYIFIPLIIIFGFQSVAQNIAVGEGIIEDYLRRQQLLGKLDSSYSFSFRPFTMTKNGLLLDENVFNKKDYFKNSFKAFNGLGSLTLLPVRVHLQYDSHHPDSRNDGAMIRSKGIQSIISAGLYAEFGPLSIQLQPEFIRAQNKPFPGFPETHFENVWASRYIWWNRMDEPERYGTGTYSRLTTGQSSIRLNKWGLSLGLSSENLWWGPAIRNSIMMSNNAQGFPHITFNTQRPQKTIIGDFEWQFITGKLKESGFDPPNTDFLARQVQLFAPKNDDDRYLQAFSFSYSPKWIKGFSLGASRWVQQYFELAKESKDFLPVISNLFRKNDNNVLINEFARDQAASIYARWLWYDSQAEIYFEFAKNDASFNLRDLLVDTDHSRALTFGLNKLFDLDSPNEFIQFQFEWNQTSQTESRLLRNALSWYMHAIVRHGYTHNGEVLGSALGPGGNAQYLEVSWVENLKKVGGAIERRVHNNDFIMEAFKDTRDFTRYWVDYSIYGFFNWRYENFMMSSSLFYTLSLNYQWEMALVPGSNPEIFESGIDANNLNLDIKFTYLF